MVKDETSLYYGSSTTHIPIFVYNARMQKRLACRITGRVQLVMFRDFTRRKAKARNITGTVKNELDGSVSVVAEGEGKALEALVRDLNRGPFLAHVDHVEAMWGEPQGMWKDFTIVY